jgi:hypothetical protein
MKLSHYLIPICTELRQRLNAGMIPAELTAGHQNTWPVQRQLAIKTPGRSKTTGLIKIAIKIPSIL